jgi:hypothetical protein
MAKTLVRNNPTAILINEAPPIIEELFNIRR